MDRRFRKQAMYGIFYVSALLGIIALIYFLWLKLVPSCFNGIQNQGEVGIDCGGSCSAVCAPRHTEPLSAVGSPLIFQIDKQHITVLASVSNPNQDYAARNFSYTFALYDGSGKILQQFPGSSYIYGGEVKYVLLANVAVASGSVSYAELNPENPAWLSSADFPGPPQFSITGVQTALSGNAWAVSGQITNKDTVAFPGIHLVAVLKGEFGQVAGASETELGSIEPNQSASFTILYPAVIKVDPYGTKVFAYAERP